MQCNSMQQKKIPVRAVPHGVVLYCAEVKDLNLAHYSITLKLW